MSTTAGSFNTKFYFVIRCVLQVAYVYISLTLVCDRDLKWSSVLKIDKDSNEITTLRIILAVVAVFSCVVYVFLLVNATRRLKVQRRTEFDKIRHQDNAMYQPVNTT